MPTIYFDGQTLTSHEGETLRNVLKRHRLTPHNGRARWFNCKGFGTCGTCAVEIDVLSGPELPEPKGREAWRLDFPPHTSDSGLRLACQIRVLGDLAVVKHPGFWGHEVPGEPEEGLVGDGEVVAIAGDHKR